MPRKRTEYQPKTLTNLRRCSGIKIFHEGDFFNGQIATMLADPILRGDADS